MNTICEETSEDQFALHTTGGEMTFILDLLNSVSHPVATLLRQVVETELRSNNKLQLNISRQTNICPKCKGEGTLSVGNLFENHEHDTEDCYKCSGAGRKILITTTRYEYLPGYEPVHPDILPCKS